MTKDALKTAIAMSKDVLKTIIAMKKDALKTIILILLLAIAFGVMFVAIASAASYFIGFAFLEVVAALQSIGILVALCLGGVFAQQRFRLFRAFQPHLTVAHHVSHRRIGDSHTHIAVTVTLLNTSKVRVELLKADFILQKIAPIPETQIQTLYDQAFVDSPKPASIQWPIIGDFTQEWDDNPLVIEPGESHNETFEFITDTHASAFLIYTYFYNPQYSERSQSSKGWGSTTIYDI